METQEFQSDKEHIDYLAKFQINPNRAMFTIILSILVDVFGYSMVFPILPNLLFVRLGATYFQYSLLIASNAISILIFSPIWGKLSDKYGRKPVLLVSQAGTGVAFLLLAFANSVNLILISRILDGIFSAQFPIARAYISDVTTPQTRASKMGKIMVGYTAGMVVGPLISAFLISFGWWFPMLVAYFLTLLSMILTIGVLVESMPKDRIAKLKAELKLKKELSKSKDRIWTRELVIRFIEVFILSLMSMIFGSSFGVILLQKYNADETIIGTIMSVSALFVMIYGLVFMRRLILRVGEKKMLFLSLSSYIIVFLIFPYLNELWMIYVLMVPYGFGMATIGPLLSSNLTKATSPDKQGRVSGWSSNFSAISQITSPFISGWFLQLGGFFIGALFFNSIQIIGITIVFLGIILLLTTYLDIKFHPKLYSYEKIRKKRIEVKKRREKEQGEGQQSELQGRRHR